ncbi:MAG TPA: hypothetical protein VHO69_17690 [Phototrophicaceae bacterium]|nr:hypothetical protein [Phototrophicaceae bacterium]
MSATSASLSTPVVPVLAQDKSSLWLRNRRWDMIFIIVSVLVVPLPYLFYLFGKDVLQVDPDVARNVINGFVAIAVGGPHMMSTMLRTGFDGDFRQRYPMLVRSAIVIPIIVVSLAFLNLTLLLTIFFFWAMLHVLHQVTYIVELYNHKEHQIIRKNSAVSLQARAIDYAVVLTCLFPMAAFKISQGTFAVGTNDLTKVIPEAFQSPWLFVAAAIVFFVALAAFVVKSVQEYRAGIINWPKTIFIGLTVAVFFPLAAFENLDTAFQGANMWHSFQYLAITFYIIKIKQQYGNLEQSAPLVSRFSKGKDSRGLFALSTLMLVGSVIVFVIMRFLAGYITPALIDPAAYATNDIYLKAVELWRFDVAYYTAILSFLWIHYYHDHFLFTNFEALDEAYK